jgi:hypothetical protein
MKGYTVFNVEQIDGLPQHFLWASTSANAFDRARRPGRSILCRHGCECRYNSYWPEKYVLRNAPDVPAPYKEANRPIILDRAELFGPY